MRDGDFNSPEYKDDYLPWASGLIQADSAEALIRQARADRMAAVNSTVLFDPPLNRLTGTLDLPQDSTFEADRVTIHADFELAQLRSLALNSLRGYAAHLNPTSQRWPVQYRDNRTAGRKDVLVRNHALRETTESLIVRTSAALLKHVVHRVPVGNIPEEAHDWTLDEGEMQRRTVNMLRNAGITTYGDLGILSLNQLQKIPQLGKAGIEDIRQELWRLRWLSVSHE